MLKRYKLYKIIALIVLFTFISGNLSVFCQISDFNIPRSIKILKPRQNEIIGNRAVIKWSFPHKNHDFVVKIIDKETLQIVQEVETSVMTLEANIDSIEPGKNYGLNIEARQGDKVTGLSDYVSFTMFGDVEDIEDEPTVENVVEAPPKSKGDSFLSKLFVSKTGRMSIIEKVGWWMAKYILVPSISMAVTTSLGVAFPPAALMVGQMLVGAGGTGIVSYLNDKRTNQLKITNKSEKEMRFDAIITAVSRIGYLPFSMVGGGIAAAGSQFTTQAIIKNALVHGGFRTIAVAASSGIAGIARHYLAHNYLDINSRILALEQQIYMILIKYKDKKFDTITAADQKKLAELEAEINKWKSKDYSWQDFLGKDIKKAAISGLFSGWGGALPKAAAGIFSRSPFTVKLSMQLFGGPGHSLQISELLTMHPFTFMSGFLGGHVEKDAKTSDLMSIIDKQKAYKEGSAEWKYYMLQVNRLEKEIKGINPIQKGVSEMALMSIIKGGNFAFKLGKARLIDMPKQRKMEIDEKYKSTVTHWKNTDTLRNKYQTLKDNPPNKAQFGNVNNYLKAKFTYDKQLSQAKEKFEISAVQSMYKDKDAQNIQLKSQISKEHDYNTKVSSNIELAKVLGRKEYLNEMVKVMKTNPTYTGKSNDQLKNIAMEKLNTHYKDSYVTLQKEMGEMSEKMGNMNKLRTNSGSFTKEQMRSIVSKQAVVTPSAYRAKFVEMKVNQLRSQGMTDQNIRNVHYDNILAQAKQNTFTSFGSSNANIYKSEVIGNILNNAKYSPDNSISLKEKITDKLSSIPELSTIG
ncbi:hypothetical protein KAJ27_22035, partial [bacterium]|nr:hypothetical protein [bacterium]